MSKDSRKARWQKWAQMPEWRLWEAVALSLNLDPDKVGTRDDAWMDGGHPFEESTEFDDRLEILHRNTGGVHGLRLRVVNMANWYQCTVGVSEFASWARRKNWRLPKELIALVDGDEPSAGELNRWPWGKYETKYLRVLAEAVRDHWLDYVPNKTLTPGNKQVAGSIRDKHPDVSNDLANYIATIIRHNDAPRGAPKRKRPGTPRARR